MQRLRIQQQCQRSIRARHPQRRAAAAHCARTYPTLIPTPQVHEISEPAALDILSAYRTASLDISGVPAPVDTAYVGPTLSGDADAKSDGPPILLIHGFDSSAAEWRRTFPKLAAHTRTYAIDVFGSGFTDVAQYVDNDELPLGPEQIRDQLRAFCEQVIQEPCIVVGASLGGTMALDFALNHPDMVSRIVLIDAQGYIDGIGPAAKGPRWLSALGVKFLQTEFLREQANQLAYFDKDKYATKDAMLIGRLHTFCPGWLEAKVAFIQSGGFKDISKQVRQVKQEVLLMWGKQDEILDPKYVAEFERDVANIRTLLIDNCGHVAHLEQSEQCAAAILDFAGVAHDAPQQLEGAAL